MELDLRNLTKEELCALGAAMAENPSAMDTILSSTAVALGRGGLAEAGVHYLERAGFVQMIENRLMETVKFIRLWNRKCVTPDGHKTPQYAGSDDGHREQMVG